MKNKILTTSEDANPNYLAQIVKLEKLEKHPNADRLLLATVNNQVVITGNTAKLGDLYVYFPVESQISEAFLSFTNSFESQENNRDPKKKGFVGKHRRIKMVKLREVFSEGYIVPAKDLVEFVKERYKQNLIIDDNLINYCFDTVGGELFINKFIVIATNPGVPKPKVKGDVKKYETKLIPGQFAFHPDTENLKRNSFAVKPDDYISLTDKLHGCNFSVANVLVKRQLNWKERVAKKLGVKVQNKEYGMLYSSRAVLKGQYFDESKNAGYYKEDLWAVVAERLFPKLDKGITAYGEIVGFTSKGAYIQKPYDYGLPQGQLDYAVFKLTYTNEDGEVFVLSHEQTVEYCERKKIPMPQVHYYGKAKDLFPEIPVESHWNEEFIKKLGEKYLEKKCSICRNDVWAEGIVLRIDKPNRWVPFKFKSLTFLKGESDQLDSGEVNIEVE